MTNKVLGVFWRYAGLSAALGAGLVGATGPARAQTAVAAAGASACAVQPNTHQVLGGAVLDPVGKPVADATVRAQCGSFLRETQTDAEGRYLFHLPVGAFTLTAQATGFAAATEQVAASVATADIDVTMNVAPSRNSVTVTAGSAFVPDESASGTKASTPLISLPQSVSVVPLEQMRQRDVQTVEDTLRYTAGVDAEPYGPDLRVDSFFIRGFDETYDGLYLDGLALPKVSGEVASWTVNPFSLSRVDVIKGPSSVLYGQNEPGGLVNTESKQPPMLPEGELRFEGGTFSRYQGFADLGGPLFGSGRWFYRINGLARSSGTQVRFAQDNQEYIAPSLTWNPDARTSLTILTNYFNVDAGSEGQFLPAQGMLLDGGKIAPNANGHIPVDTFDSDPSYDDFHKIEYFSGYEFRRALNDRWVFRQNFRFSHLELPTYTGLYGTGFVAPAGDSTLCIDDPNAAACTRLLSRSAINSRVNNSQALVDNQFQGDLRAGTWTNTVLAGYNYNHEGSRVQLGYGPSAAYDPAGTPGLSPNLDIFAPVYNVPVPIPGFTTTNTNGTLEQHGVYLQDQIARNKLSVILSGREDWAPENTRDYLAGDVIQQNASKFTGRAGVLYGTSIGIAPYFSYATSFNPIPGVDAYGHAYVPDTGAQYEVGAKWQPRGVQAFLTASLFQVTEDHVQTTDPANPLNTVQTAQQRSRGVEVEGQASLGHNFDLVGAFTHQQVLYTKPYYGVTDVKPETVPDNLASLWTNYNPRHGFGAGAGVRFAGVTPGDSNNSFFVPGSTLMDGEVHYTTGPVRVGMNGQNLLDKTYVAYCYGTTDCNYGYQRTFNGNLTYSFASLRHPWKSEQ